MATNSSFLPGESHGQRSMVGYCPWVPKELDTTEQLTQCIYIYILEKEMATHSSVLAWRIPGTGEPSGLPSMGSHGRTRLKRLSSIYIYIYIYIYTHTHTYIYIIFLPTAVLLHHIFKQLHSIFSYVQYENDSYTWQELQGEFTTSGHSCQVDEWGYSLLFNLKLLFSLICLKYFQVVKPPSICSVPNVRPYHCLLFYICLLYAF